MDGNIEAAKAKTVNLSAGPAYKNMFVYMFFSQTFIEDLMLLHQLVIRTSLLVSRKTLEGVKWLYVICMAHKQRISLLAEVNYSQLF